MTAQMILHATTVTFDERAIVLLGASGSGKSALALQLLALGAILVADDQTVLTLQDGKVVASCPPGLEGLVEARGVGLLNTPHRQSATVTLVVDLDQIETARLPDHRHITILGVPLSLVLGLKAAHFPSALKHYALYGRRA
jgi:HPr kinase/phosphorylase